MAYNKDHNTFTTNIGDPTMNDSYPNYYPPHEDPAAYTMAYGTSAMPSYPVMHDTPQTRALSDIQQQQQHQHQPMQPPYHAFPHQAQQYQPQPVYNNSHSDTPHVLPITTNTTPPPPSPDLYDPLSPPVSGSDSSAEGLYHHNSSGQNSPISSRSNSLVHRSSRYNPTPSPTSSSGRGSRTSRGSRSQDSDDEDMGVLFSENLAHSRKEATRRQRIEAEQRRRDELRDGYAKLKDVLPVSNQKSSKVSLLDRATQYIQTLERQNQDLQKRLQEMEQEMHRLRSLNEKIALSADTPPAVFTSHSRPLSPPPEAHSLTGGRDPSSESSSPSASEVY